MMMMMNDDDDDGDNNNKDLCLSSPSNSNYLITFMSQVVHLWPVNLLKVEKSEIYPERCVALHLTEVVTV